jgi:SHS2 domain-containing protein
MAAKTKPYRLIDHTGDLGLEVRGDDFPGLLVNAAWAFTDILVDAARVRSHRVQDIAVEAPDREALLAAWLGELLYLFDARGLVFGRFEIREWTEERLAGRAWGEPFDPDRHGFKQGVKAVTYHQLRIRRTAKGWRARVILDI